MGNNPNRLVASGPHNFDMSGRLSMVREHAHDSFHNKMSHCALLQQEPPSI